MCTCVRERVKERNEAVVEGDRYDPGARDGERSINGR